jgi:hypothetical protein
MIRWAAALCRHASDQAALKRALRHRGLLKA